MKKKLLILITISAVAILLVLSLFIKAKIRENKSNGFVRNFEKYKLHEFGGDIDVEAFWTIAGLSSSKIFLGNQKLVHHFKEISITRRISISKKILGAKFQNTSFARAELTIDSPCFYIRDSYVSKFFMGNINNWSANEYKMPKIRYDKSVITKGGDMILRLNDSKSGLFLGKTTLSSNKVLVDKALLEAQGDDFFSKDGLLIRDSASGNIVYVYLYRNDFLAIDSNLSFQFKAKTIDTVTQSKLHVASNGRNNLSISSPAIKVNKIACLWNNLLYVNSGLRADNETLEDFNTSSVIDVYDLKKRGHYQYSFHLKGNERDKLKQFKVRGNLLVALYDRSLKTFRIK